MSDKISDELLDIEFVERSEFLDLQIYQSVKMPWLWDMPANRAAEEENPSA